MAEPEATPEADVTAGADHELILRRDAAQATLDCWCTRPFRLGSADCGQMAARHLRSAGIAIRLPPSGSYRTPKGAVRALRKLGFDGLTAWIDGTGLERIAPAAALAGDILQLPADHPLGALAVALGNGAAVGWYEGLDMGAVTLRPLLFQAAWRVPFGRTAA